METTNIIRFSTLLPVQLPVLESILGYNVEDMKTCTDRYYLCATDKSSIYNCPITDIRYKEVIATPSLKVVYDEMVNMYGQEKMDIFVIKDDEVISKRIVDILTFAMDKVFKCDTIFVLFARVSQTTSKCGTIGDVIIDAITNNFQWRPSHVTLSVDGQSFKQSAIKVKKKEDQK